MELQQAQEWLLNNLLLITTSQRFTEGQKLEFFTAYNALTGDNKTQTSCGRCISNMKSRFRIEYQKLITNMKTYNVYKTTKGNLSFKEKGNIVLIIRAHSDSLAEVQLKALQSGIKNKQEDGV